MISGYFAEDGEPYVRCRVHLLKFTLVEEIDFLVDTGSDTTILHPEAGIKLGCPFAELSNPLDVTGAGGSHTYYAEPAVVSFYDEDTRHDFRIDLHIGKPDPVTNGLDSLLGRDVLNELDMQYAPRRGQLVFSLDAEP